jgi:hypothetical protein
MLQRESDIGPPESDARQVAAMIEQSAMQAVHGSHA